ncbi:MAG: hypothetical protein WC756_17670 [Taibaiella sp.]|jgi:hypothetical protein
MPPQTKKTAIAGKSKDIRVANEVTLDAKNPIPFEYTGASFNIEDGNPYIPFLFPNDSFFSTLQEARLLSPTQSACISTKADYSIGNGLTIKGLDKDKWEPGFKAFMEKANRKKHSFNTVLKKGFEAFFNVGNVPVEIVKGSVGKRKFLYVYVHNFLDCRLSIPNKNTGEIDSMVYSKRFRKKGIITDMEGVKVIPFYDRGLGKNKSWIQDPKTKVERTALWLKNEYVGYDDYGLPSNVASLVHQVIEYQGARYNMDNLENNMVLGGAIILAGNVSQTQADKLGRKIISQHTGSGKRGRIAVFASEAGIEQSKFMPFDTRKEGSYKELSAEARDVIILSNQWDAVLAGLQSESALGKGAGYLEEVYEQKMNTVINPVQNFFLENFIAPIAEIAKDWLGEDWTKQIFEIVPKQIRSSGNKALLYSAEGIRITLEVIKAIAEGWYTVDAAVKMLSNRFGCSEDQARDEIGVVGKIPYKTKKGKKEEL